MEALLANYPNLRAVIAPTTVGIAAAAQVVQSRGIAEQVAVTGLGLPSEMRDFVKDGTVTAFQLWSPYNEGWLAAHFAKGVLEGRSSTSRARPSRCRTWGRSRSRQQRD
jgi:rhamnose transport system substrate-binding protein